MLKSTYRPSLKPLPKGWTEHKAPTGHTYYYNAATKQSTYTRPAETSQQASPRTEETFPNSALLEETRPESFLSSITSNLPESSRFAFNPKSETNNVKGNAGFGRQDNRHRTFPKDRPRSKHPIPGSEPWILVKTKLGRRFVFNSEENYSLWRFPPDVLKGVIEFDRLEREGKAKGDYTASTERHNNESAVAADTLAATSEGPSAARPPNANAPSRNPDYNDSDEYEEVEVTDDEDVESAAKRQKAEGGESPEQPVEFNEDDIAYQLAAMGQDYGLDPGEYGNGGDEDLEEGAEGLPLTADDAKALFQDLLDDHHINPYTPWETIVSSGQIVEDDRYTVLPNMRSRKEVWSEWSRDRIQQVKEQREKEEKKDPRIPYLTFLQTRATPKLYWPEFRRKYMKEPEMRHNKISDKEREKWYRDYISRLKLPESTLKSDLVSLLKSMPLRDLNRSTSMELLPPTLLTDIRFVSLRAAVRDPLVEAHISTLPEAPEDAGGPHNEEGSLAEQKQARDRRKALAERQLQVQREKKKAREALEYSRGVLKEGEREIQEAMKVRKDGLLGHMAKDEPPPLPPPEATI